MYKEVEIEATVEDIGQDLVVDTRRLLFSNLSCHKTQVKPIFMRCIVAGLASAAPPGTSVTLNVGG